MREEVNAAIGFLAKFMQSKLSKEHLEQFTNTLQKMLHIQYKDHWFPEAPHRGSAYRCIRINNQVMDPLLDVAARESGIPNFLSLRLFPDELTMWIDPSDVSYRIGENGSIGQVDVCCNEPQQYNSYYKATDINSLPANFMKSHSSCKDQLRDLTSRLGYPRMYAAFAS